MTQLLTPKQVAARLAVSPRTVYLWIEQGRLPAVRLSERVTRVSEEALAAFEAAGVAAGSTSVPPHGASFAAEEAAGYGTAILEPSRDAVTPTQRLRSLLEKHRGEILEVAQRRRTENLRVFGSVARGDARDGSDIDILVDLMPHASLFDLNGLHGELEVLLGVDVDVVPAKNLKPQIRDRVLDEAIPL
jgi:excisionase family DNA binding protein